MSRYKLDSGWFLDGDQLTCQNNASEKVGYSLDILQTPVLRLGCIWEPFKTRELNLILLEQRYNFSQECSSLSLCDQICILLMNVKRYENYLSFFDYQSKNNHFLNFVHYKFITSCRMCKSKRSKTQIHSINLC